MIERLSIFVWVAVFLALELPARDVFGVWPWYSLSRTVQLGEAWWWPVGLYVALFMFVLLGHFELGWHARWVVAVTVFGVLLILSHVLVRVTP